MHGLIGALAGALALLTASEQVSAQSWPARPIKFIVSQAAGGTPDIICRLIAEKLSRALGQQVVVDNKPGGGNVIGAQAAARSAPDGYTFFFATAAALVTNPYTFKSLPYDPARDFVPVSMVASNPFFLLANPGLAAKTLPELIALAKAEPGKLLAATDGQRNFSGMLTAWFNKRAGTSIVQVPYATMPQGAQDALAGRVQLVVLAVPSAAALMEQGQLRALGVSSLKRLPGFEGTPSISETLPGFDFIGWFAVVAPTGTPAEVIQRMNHEVDAALKDVEIARRMRDVAGAARAMGKNHPGDRPAAGMSAARNLPVAIDSNRTDAMSQYKLVTYQSPQGPRAGLVVDQTVFDVAAATGRPSYATMLDVLRDWDAARGMMPDAAGAAARKSGGLPLDSVKLLTPVPTPAGIFCAGANFTDHMMEMAQVQNLKPEPDPHSVGLKPWHFIKAMHCLAAPDSTVKLPAYSKMVDWEAELTAVIGRPARDVSIGNALSHVAGYTVANDLSARDFTKRPHIADNSPFKYDWLSQKCFENACPVGPWIVPADTIADPQNVGIKLWVNDVIKQDSHTSKMIFTLAEQIAHLSTRVTLQPGDLILTGTPAGVGLARKEFLRSGDVVKVWVEGVGTLVNTCA